MTPTPLHPSPCALALLCALLCCAGPARADDVDALSLADQAPASPPPAASPWRVFGEAAVFRQAWRGGPSSDEGRRASLDVHYEGSLAPGLRGVLSDRLDLTHSDVGRENNLNTLRQAYLSWQVRPDFSLDAGRVNLRHGAAMGYNPTDFFRANAVRSIVSPDPHTLRENRQGTVVLQGQQVWRDSAFSAALSPRLKRTRDDDTFSPDFGATNDRNRWLLTASHRFSERFNPQVLLHGGEDTPLQLGLNLSALVNPSTVAFAEFAGGKGRSLRAQALGLPEAEGMQRRAAAGLTYTTRFNLSLTAEFHHNSAAPDRAQWDALRLGPPGGTLRLLSTANALQDLPTRQGVLLYASWKDLLVRQLDLTAFVRRDTETGSQFQWVETRYRWRRMDMALQYQLASGGGDTLYGTVPAYRAVTALARVYF